MRASIKLAVLLGAVALLATTPSTATILKHMNLEDLSGGAERIYTGTVLDAEKGRVEVGGGELPIVTYRVVVDTSFQGSFTEVKGVRIAEIRMLGDIPSIQVGDAVRRSALPAMPKIEVGKRYLFFTTVPVGTGLSATVGLGQGLFRLTGEPGDELAVNEYDNRGLFAGMSVSGVPSSGPIPLSDLSDYIRAHVGGK